MGVVKGMDTVRFDLLKKMLASWIAAPLAAFLVCFIVTIILEKMAWL